MGWGLPAVAGGAGGETPVGSREAGCGVVAAPIPGSGRRPGRRPTRSCTQGEAGSHNPALRRQFTRNLERNQPPNSTRDCLRVSPGWAATGGTSGLPVDRWTGIPGAQSLFSSRPEVSPGAHHRREITADATSAGVGRSRRGIPAASSGGGTPWNAVKHRGPPGAPQPGPHGRTVNLAKTLHITAYFGSAAFAAQPDGRRAGGSDRAICHCNVVHRALLCSNAAERLI